MPTSPSTSFSSTLPLLYDADNYDSVSDTDGSGGDRNLYIYPSEESLRASALVDSRRTSIQDATDLPDVLVTLVLMNAGSDEVDMPAPPSDQEMGDSSLDGCCAPNEDGSDCSIGISACVCFCLCVGLGVGIAAGRGAL